MKSSSTKTELAAFLALLAGLHNRGNLTSLSEVAMCQQINKYGILSQQSISAVVGCSVWQVENSLRGMTKPTARGRLNPSHLSMLAYVLSKGKITEEWLNIFLEEGTSLSTISDLTGIAESTLYRHKGKIAKH